METKTNEGEKMKDELQHKETENGRITLELEIPEVTSVVKLYKRQEALEWHAKRINLPRLMVFDYRSFGNFSVYGGVMPNFKPAIRYSPRSEKPDRTRIWFLTLDSPILRGNYPGVERYFQEITTDNFIVSGFFKGEDDKFIYHYINIECSDDEYVAIRIKDENKIEGVIRRLENEGAKRILYGRQVDPNKTLDFYNHWKKNQEKVTENKRTREISDFFKLPIKEQRKFLEGRL